jgi:hypothetical protein
MADIWNFLVSQWNTWPVQLVVWSAVLCLLLAVGVFVVRRLRDFATGNDDSRTHLVTNFREMKVQGDISDAEFRTINALLNGKQPPKVNQARDNT